MDIRNGGTPPATRRRHGAAMHRPAATALACTIKAGAKDYDRARDLPALIRCDPFAGIPESADGVAAIVARLERALRAERNRARSGHWTYDLNRHIALRQAYLAESERLKALRSGRRTAPVPP